MPYLPDPTTHGLRVGFLRLSDQLLEVERLGVSDLARCWACFNSTVDPLTEPLPELQLLESLLVVVLKRGSGVLDLFDFFLGSPTRSEGAVFTSWFASSSSSPLLEACFSAWSCAIRSFKNSCFALRIMCWIANFAYSSQNSFGYCPEAFDLCEPTTGS